MSQLSLAINTVQVNSNAICKLTLSICLILYTNSIAEWQQSFCQHLFHLNTKKKKFRNFNVICVPASIFKKDFRQLCVIPQTHKCKILVTLPQAVLHIKVCIPAHKVPKFYTFPLLYTGIIT